MSIISISITESSIEIMSGIPRYVTLSTNVPSTIFYTLDGTDPTLDSDIYTDPISFDGSSSLIILKIYATNGTISSPIITEVYQNDILNNARLPHSATTAQPTDSLDNLYPYGTNEVQPTSEFLNPGDAGITVNDPSLEQIPSGYDGDGYENAFTNEPYTIENYSIVYSNRDFNGEYSIGRLPADVTIEVPSKPPEETEQFSRLFDPRAFVIFQNFEDESITDPPNINREYFTLEDYERARDGTFQFTSGLDTPQLSGTFLRSHYNPKDNSITYYYYDSKANKWIISKSQYSPIGTFDGDLSQVKFGRDRQTVGIVLEWLPFTRRVLF